MTTDEHLDKIVARCQLLADLIVPSHAFTSVVVAIEGLRRIADKGSHPESSSAKCDLHKINNLWPEELL
jgi:hypothetical protein